MIAHICLDTSDGSICVYEGTSDEGKEIATVPAAAMVLLDLFNENRRGFTWEGDTERAQELLGWMLEDAGYEVDHRYIPEFNRNMITLLTPGPVNGCGFMTALKEL